MKLKKKKKVISNYVSTYQKPERNDRCTAQNPRGEPTGPWTGRCSRCGSNDLWDDATVYGCNHCHAMFSN